MEALNFLAGGAALNPLKLQGYSIRDVHDLIPIGKRANFNDEIAIRARYEFDGEDNRMISDHLWNQFRFDLTKRIEGFVLKRSYRFKDSKLIEDHFHTYWPVSFIGKRKRAHKERELKGDEWQERSGNSIVRQNWRTFGDTF